MILILLVWLRQPADLAGTVGWICALLLTWLYFGTPLINSLMISLSGAVASLPITIMVATSLLQITIMKETGAIDRVVAFIKTIAPGDQVPADLRLIQANGLQVQESVLTGESVPVDKGTQPVAADAYGQATPPDAFP